LFVNGPQALVAGAPQDQAQQVQHLRFVIQAQDRRHI
jgi:hypothetical protein